jgi:hypothetical protein
MKTQWQLLTAFIPVGMVLTALADGCKEPVQVQLRISTTLPCATVGGTGAGNALNDFMVFAGPSEADVRKQIRESRDSNIVTPRIIQPVSCPTSMKNGYLGDVELVKEKAGEVFVAVVAGLSLSAQTPGAASTKRSSLECGFASDNEGAYGAGQADCLIAVRRFKYTSNARSQVRASLDASCVNLKPACATGQACVAGVCEGAQVDLVPGALPPESPPQTTEPMPTDTGSTMPTSTGSTMPTSTGTTMPTSTGSTMPVPDAGTDANTSLCPGLDPSLPSLMIPFTCSSTGLNQATWSEPNFICNGTGQQRCLNVCTGALECTPSQTCLVPCCLPDGIPGAQTCCPANLGRFIDLRAGPPTFGNDGMGGCTQ